MPGERLSMRQIREVLRLRFASSCRSGRLPRAWAEPGGGQRLSEPGACASLVWPLPEDLDDAQLEALLFPLRRRSPRISAAADWAGCIASCVVPM